MHKSIERQSSCEAQLGDLGAGLVESAGTSSRSQSGPGGVKRQRVVARLVLLSVLFCVVSIGRSAWLEFGPPSHHPRIRVAYPELDFGERHVGETVEYEFELANSGSENLIISNVTASCRCIVAALGEATVPPQYRVRIPVRVSLDAASPLFQQQVIVESNDPIRPQIVLTISGRIVPAPEVHKVRLRATRSWRNSASTKSVTSSLDLAT